MLQCGSGLFLKNGKKSNLPLSVHAGCFKQATYINKPHGRSRGCGFRGQRSFHLNATFGPLLRFRVARMESARFLHYSHLRVSPIRVCGLGGARMSSTSGLRFVFSHRAHTHEWNHARKNCLGSAKDKGIAPRAILLPLLAPIVRLQTAKTGLTFAGKPAPLAMVRMRALLEVARDELGHLEHAHLLFAAEDGLQAFVRIDHGSLLLVL